MTDGIIDNFLRDLIAKKVFNIEEDGIRLFKDIKYSAISAKSLAIMFQEISKKIGDEEKAKKYLYDIGFEAGEDAAKEMITGMSLQEKIISNRVKMVQIFMEIIGFGKSEFLIYNVKEKKILIHLTNHPVINWANKLYGKDSKICDYYRGVYCAHAANELGLPDAKVIETQCITKGAKFCEWSFGVLDQKKTK